MNISVDLCIAEFQSKDVLDVIPHFLFWVALWMKMHVWPLDLALVRCVQLFVSISAVVSMSMNQSSSLRSPAHQMGGYPGAWSG